MDLHWKIALPKLTKNKKVINLIDNTGAINATAFIFFKKNSAYIFNCFYN